ncbi:MAG: restriction endonuclease [Clostridiales bacterium]|nr:restriction endonuclease [Clostridiales bacterium]
MNSDAGYILQQKGAFFHLLSGRKLLFCFRGSAIRDFRGSLTTDIEKEVLITTGAFSKAAREEASNPGKQQIDLIDGEELISKIAEFGIGVREVKSYEVDAEFFKKN